MQLVFAYYYLSAFVVNSFLDTAAVGFLDCVQAALSFGRAAPATGTFVGFPQANGPRARPAADAGVTLVVERVVRNVLGENPFPDVAFGHIRQRTDFYEIEFLVPTHDRRLRAVSALIAADATHPRMLAFGRAAQDFDLAVEAALIRIGFIKWPAVEGFVFGNGKFGLEHVDLDAILRGNAVAQIERLLELVAGVEIEDISFRRDLGEHREDHAAFGSERRGHGQVRGESLMSPCDDFLGRGRFQPRARLGQFGHELGRRFQLQGRARGDDLGGSLQLAGGGGNRHLGFPWSENERTGSRPSEIPNAVRLRLNHMY